MRLYQSEGIAKLSDALSKAQAETQHAAKSAENPFYKSKYADLPAVIDAARPHLSKHGLAVTQMTDFDEAGMLLITQVSHSSGEWIRGYYPVRPIKNDPQGLGSALTYARRYSYQSIVGIATSADDDDGNQASNVENKPVYERKSVFKNAALRKTFHANCVESFHVAKTLEELKQLAALNAAKFKEMEESGNEHDALSLEEMRKQYQIAMNRLLIATRETPEEEVPAYVREMDEKFNAATR